MSIDALSGQSSATVIGLSGMRAAQARLDTTAHNVANAMTEGFQRQTLTQTTQAGGGVQVSIGKEAQALSADSPVFGDLAGDMVEERMSLYSFQANLQTVKTEDEMLGSLLSTRA